MTMSYVASFLILLLSGLPLPTTTQEIPGLSRTMFVAAMLTDYDSGVTPTFDKDYETVVNVSLHVNGINSVNEQHMDFSVNMYLTQTWVDPRLTFNGLIPSDMLELDSKLISKFWVPDLYFVNEKSSDFHDVTVPNRLMHIYEDGTVVYKTRITVTASCEMALHNFPFDQQNCSLYIKSFGYSRHNLVLNWNDEDPLTYNTNLKMSQFTLNDLQHRDCHDLPPPTTNDTNMTDPLGLGEAHVLENRTKPLFCCLAVDFILHRSVGFYAIQIYVPSALIVFLSWVSFVLDVAAVPARISLGILTVLTMTNMKSIAVSSLPKVSYIKAIDVWMAACLGFVFASLLEFAIVNAFSRRDRGPFRMSGPETEPLKDKKGLDVASTNVTVRNRKVFAARGRARDLDRLSLILFPASFIFFIIIYLLIYFA